MPAISGTPAYMAPEQLAGRPERASDQYGFAVALWEVLAGARPDLAATPPPSPRALRAPGNVRRALARALAIEPAQRFASMSALVDALVPPRWHRFAIAGAAAVVVLGVVAFATLRMAGDRSKPALGRADQQHVHKLTDLGPTTCASSPTVVGDDQVGFERTRHVEVDQ